MTNKGFQIGDVVKLKPDVVRHEIKGVETHSTASISAFLKDVEGGVVLDRRIGCVRFWNVEDLDLVARASTSPRP